MVNKCAAPECRTGYESVRKSQLHFPLEKIELNKQWIRFVNRKDWETAKNSVLSELHLEERFIIRRKKYNLSYSMSLVSRSHFAELAKTPSISPTPQTCRQPRRKESFKKMSQNVSVTFSRSRRRNMVLQMREERLLNEL